LAGDAGLDTDGGIAVGPTMATAADGILAVGDIARAHHDVAGRTVKYVAWGDGHDEVHVQRSGSGTTVRYGRNGRVVGVLTHDHDEDNEQAEADVHAGRPMPG